MCLQLTVGSVKVRGQNAAGAWHPEPDHINSGHLESQVKSQTQFTHRSTTHTTHHHVIRISSRGMSQSEVVVLLPTNTSYQVRPGNLAQVKEYATSSSPHSQIPSPRPDSYTAPRTGDIAQISSPSRDTHLFTHKAPLKHTD
jgi:hypothetical protein